MTTTQPTNAVRAKRFARLLRRYNTYDTDPCRLIDLLADARHWCDQHGQSFAHLDRVAHEHYLVELQIERRPS
ncbi:MAG: hypothetical protein IT450_08395 [Phycisphaerales bacterium]|nr:hypothetical protein [Phycisphaerales bacterium]